MEQPEVTQLPPLEQAQQPPTVSARVDRAPPWTLPWGIDAVRAYNKLPLGIARPHVGEDDAVFIGERVGGVDPLDDGDGTVFGTHSAPSFLF